MHYYTLIIRRNYFAECIYWLFTKSLYVHKIVDDLYIFFYVEYFVGLLFEIFRNRGNGITMVNRKCHYRRISFIPPYKRDISTMQSSYNRHISAPFFKYLLCHISRGSMRDGIVYM